MSELTVTKLEGEAAEQAEIMFISMSSKSLYNTGCIRVFYSEAVK